jgi:hypothetical protein
VKLPRLAGPSERADVIELLFTGKVIPLHRRWMEGATAIRAGHRCLHRTIQGDEPIASLLRLPFSLLSITQVVCAVVLAPAQLAPRLVSMTRIAMELV